MLCLPHQAIREAVAYQRRKSKGGQGEMASELDITEAELVAAHVAASAAIKADWELKAIPLKALWPQVIEAVEPIGQVTALTRNGSCIHEKTGVYYNASHFNQLGVILTDTIDLRLGYQRWQQGFAVSEMTESGWQRSLQFFDASGAAVHKIYLSPTSDRTAYDDLVKRFTAQDQGADELGKKNSFSPQPNRVDSIIDAADFRRAWSSLHDTDVFFGMLERFSGSHTQALHLARSPFAQPIAASSASLLLYTAAQRGVPIMVLVSNPGAIQIHTGPVHRISVVGTWLNVLDEGFKLHLRVDHIASAWVVKKPTTGGIVTSLELFDSQDQSIAMFFGERQPGKPELCSWRVLIDKLVRESASCVF